jgi:ABC-type phosphate/phosphonate transport system permease subunit
MDELRTDDAIRRTRLKFLGPKEWTLPVHLTFTQWAIYTAFVIPCSIVALAISSYAIGLGAMVGIVAGWAVNRQISPDRPARAVIRTITTDWRGTRPPTDKAVEPQRFTTRHLTEKEGGRS